MEVAQDERPETLDVVRRLPHVQALWALQEQFAQDGPRGRFQGLDADSRRPLYQAAALLAVAIDHLVAFELLVRSGGIPTWAPFSVLRPAVEASQRASWLLEAKGQERIERSLAFEWEDATETGKDNAALLAAADGNIPPEVAHEADRVRSEADARRRELLRTAARLGVQVATRQPKDEQGRRPKPVKYRGADVADSELSEVAWLGTPYPSATELLRRMVDDEPTYGPLVYRRLSSTIHGRPSPTRPVTLAVADGPDEDGYVAAEQSVRLEEIDTAAFVSTVSVVSAAMVLADNSGYCRHRVGLAPRKRLGAAAPTRRLWPPARQVWDGSVPVQASCVCCRGTPMYNYSGDASTSLVLWCPTCPPLHEADRVRFASITGHQFSTADGG